MPSHRVSFAPTSSDSRPRPRVSFAQSSGARRLVASRNAPRLSGRIDPSSLLHPPTAQEPKLAIASFSAPTPASAPSMFFFTHQEPASEVCSPVNVLERDLKEAKKKMADYKDRYVALKSVLVRTKWTPVKHPRLILRQKQELALVKKFYVEEKKKSFEVEVAIQKAQHEELLKKRDAELEELFNMEE